MKHKSTLLLVALALVAALTGCKKDQINVNDQLTQMSGEKFLTLKYASVVEASDHAMSAMQYTLNHADKTATLNVFEYGDGVPTVKETKVYNYVLGGWGEGMFGRVLTLSNEEETFDLLYVNNTLKDAAGVLYDVAEPVVEIAGTTTELLETGDWATYDPTYVMQDHWTFDTTWYVTHRSGKKWVIDTITGRYKHAEKVPVGVQKQNITYLRFHSDPLTYAKTACWSEGVQVNTIDTFVNILPQIQDPTKNDTIITMTIIPGVATREVTDSIDHWNLVDVKEGAFEVMAHLVGAPAEQIEDYKMASVTDSTFTLNKKTYHKLNK